MKLITNTVSILFILISLTSNPGCDNEPPIELVDIPESSPGIAPVYDTEQEWKEIDILPPRTIQFPNTRLSQGQFQYINGTNEGIDVTRTNSPNAIAFISIPNLHDMNISGVRLFAGNFNDRLTFDIRDPFNILLINREEDFYQNLDPLNLPYEYQGFIECPDFNKGHILRWERVTLDDPECWN